MIKEFLENVQRLYDETVQDKSVRTNQSAADLLDVLLRKVTQPIQVFKDNTCVRAIYYNVSVSLAHNLSSMDIAYNSDYHTTFHDLTSCDLHQLSEFILALERDIPKWRHIWVADDKLRKEKAKIGERLVSSLQQFRYDLMSGQMYDDEKRIERFRIKYYNLKACKMCLDNDNPFWENKKTEAEILEECRTLHMDPPMEQWYSDFTDFVDGCKQMRDERDRKREEQKRELEETLRAFERAQRDKRFGSETLRDTYIVQLLVQIGRISPVPEPEEKRYDPKIRETLSYINEHLGEELSVGELAEQVYLSRYHFMRLFKAQTGETVHAYVRQKRLLYAARLIREGVPANRAAADAGFTD